MPDSRVPSFAQSFPQVPELDALVEAFARGDYATVRERAPVLARSAEDPQVRASAQVLVERTRPDPLAVALLALTALLLVALGGYWMANGKAPPAGPPPVSPPASH
jgi:hypothetical protein